MMVRELHTRPNPTAPVIPQAQFNTLTMKRPQFCPPVEASSLEEEWEQTDMHGDHHWGQGRGYHQADQFYNRCRGGYGGYQDMGGCHQSFVGDYGQYHVRMKIPLFDGNFHIQEIDWLSEVDKFFDIMDVPEHRKVKLVAIRLKEGVIVWWDQTVANRAWLQKLPVQTWRKMKTMQIMRRYSSRSTNCHQGTRLVSDYTEEFHHLALQNNLQESEDQLVGTL